jgi:putative phosphoribosyl transferase
MSFKNRSDAGRQLAARLANYKGQEPVLLALPRGGVPVAAEVAAALGAPIDLVLVRKIGVPSQPELAMGAIVDGDPPMTVRNEAVIRLAGVNERGFLAVRDKEYAELERRRRLYLGGRNRISVKDRVAIVIDDGIATGATARAALRAIRTRQPKSSSSRCRSAPLIRSRRCGKKPMKSTASRFTRILTRSALSMMISGKSRIGK